MMTNMLSNLTKKERWVIVAVLLAITVIIGADIATDYREGVRSWHIVAEGTVAVSAIVGILYLLSGSFSLKHSLEAEQNTSEELRQEAERWKNASKKYLQGLSLAIDTQLSKWHLTDSEKEVAFLLLKGLSLKEIAETRKTSERTARTQAVSIYAKAGLSGRSEFAAFFLEDLLPPTTPTQGN